MDWIIEGDSQVLGQLKLPELSQEITSAVRSTSSPGNDGSQEPERVHSIRCVIEDGREGVSVVISVISAVLSRFCSR